MDAILTTAINFAGIGFCLGMAAGFAMHIFYASLPTKQESEQVHPVVNPVFLPNPDGFSEATEEQAALVETHQVFVAQFWSEPVAEVEVLPDPWSGEMPAQTQVVPMFTNPPRLLLLPAAKTDYSKLTVKQLQAELKAKGINPGKRKKAELVQLLSA